MECPLVASELLDEHCQEVEMCIAFILMVLRCFIHGKENRWREICSQSYSSSDYFKN
jgi:hypothetical protein